MPRLPDAAGGPGSRRPNLITTNHSHDELTDPFTDDGLMRIVAGLVKSYPTPEIMRHKANQLVAARKDASGLGYARLMRAVADDMESGELWATHERRTHTRRDSGSGAVRGAACVGPAPPVCGRSRHHQWVAAMTEGKFALDRLMDALYFHDEYSGQEFYTEEEITALVMTAIREVRKSCACPVAKTQSTCASTTWCRTNCGTAMGLTTGCYASAVSSPGLDADSPTGDFKDAPINNQRRFGRMSDRLRDRLAMLPVAAS